MEEIIESLRNKIIEDITNRTAFHASEYEEYESIKKELPKVLSAEEIKDTIRRTINQSENKIKEHEKIIEDLLSKRAFLNIVAKVASKSLFKAGALEEIIHTIDKDILLQLEEIDDEIRRRILDKQIEEQTYKLLKEKFEKAI